MTHFSTADLITWRMHRLYLRVRGWKRTALASYPRSGNTWLRYMVEGATGLPSGSVYKDRVLPRNHNGVIIKTHELDAVQYSHAIHLVRNPFDAIESAYFHRRDIVGEELSWDEHVAESVIRWQQHTEHWLSAGIPTLLTRYEDLLADPANELQRVLTWMGYRISEEDVRSVVEKSTLENMRTLAPSIGNQFFRRGTTGHGREMFSPAQVAVLNATLGPIMQRLSIDIPSASTMATQ